MIDEMDLQFAFCRYTIPESWLRHIKLKDLNITSAVYFVIYAYVKEPSKTMSRDSEFPTAQTVVGLRQWPLGLGSREDASE
jgi:hypothetical protein